MTTLTNQIRLIQSWGFSHHVAGMYYRNIYNDQGYTEQWNEQNPDYIQFIKGGHVTESYKISWKLFDHKAA